MNDDDDPILLRLKAEHFELPDVADESAARMRKMLLASVAHRRRTRRGYAVALVAASYAAGIATMFAAAYIYEAGPSSIQSAKAPGKSPTPQEQPAPIAPTKIPMRELVRDPEAFARRLADAKPDERIRLLRLAGDTYLTEYDDIKTAARLYSRMLALCGKCDTEKTNSTDTWLLASLKQAKLKEIGNDHSGI